MVDFKSRQEDEIEKLTRTLKSSRLATSESEARRMAEEMLGISKKVADDFKKREQQILGNKKMNVEQDLAHKQMEMLAANIASGKSNARLDLSDLNELDVNKPLKDLISEQEDQPDEKEEDDAVELTSADEKVTEIDDVVEPADEKDSVDESLEEPSEQSSSWDKPVDENKEEPKQEVEEADVGDEGPEPDDDSEAGSEEEKAEEAPEEDAPEKPAGEEIDPEAAEEDDSEGTEAGDDFSVKELDSAPVKSDGDRKQEIESMEESRIDLSNVFNANR